MRLGSLHGPPNPASKSQGELLGAAHGPTVGPPLGAPGPMGERERRRMVDGRGSEPTGEQGRRVGATLAPELLRMRKCDLVYV